MNLSVLPEIVQPPPRNINLPARLVISLTFIITITITLNLTLTITITSILTNYYHNLNLNSNYHHISNLNSTSPGTLLVTKYPDKLAEYSTVGELMTEITVKVEGLELSHAIKLDDHKLVVVLGCFLGCCVV